MNKYKEEIRIHHYRKLIHSIYTTWHLSRTNFTIRYTTEAESGKAIQAKIIDFRKLYIHMNFYSSISLNCIIIFPDNYDSNTSICRTLSYWVIVTVNQRVKKVNFKG